MRFPNIRLTNLQIFIFCKANWEVVRVLWLVLGVRVNRLNRVSGVDRVVKVVGIIDYGWDHRLWLGS